MSALAVLSLSEEKAAWLDELTAIMLQQELLCRRLVDLSARERVAVLSGQVDDVEDSTREKRGLLSQLEQQESVRRAVAGRLAEEMGLPEDASLADLAERTEMDTAQELLEVRSRLVHLASRLRESNESNLSLLRRSMASVRDSLRHLRQSMVTGETYGSTGQPVLTAGSAGNVALDLHA